MTELNGMDADQRTIAFIENRARPGQVVAIQYLAEKGAFVTCGIQEHFAEKEIMVPAHLAVRDFQLIGTIISALLEKLSEAQDEESGFAYASHFEVLGTFYLLRDAGPYVCLCLAENALDPERGPAGGFQA